MGSFAFLDRIVTTLLDSFQSRHNGVLQPPSARNDPPHVVLSLPRQLQTLSEKVSKMAEKWRRSK